jgi:hypothetical protein
MVRVEGVNTPFVRFVTQVGAITHAPLAPIPSIMSPPRSEVVVVY